MGADGAGCADMRPFPIVYTRHQGCWKRLLNTGRKWMSHQSSRRAGRRASEITGCSSSPQTLGRWWILESISKDKGQGDNWDNHLSMIYIYILFLLWKWSDLARLWSLQPWRPSKHNWNSPGQLRAVESESINPEMAASPSCSVTPCLSQKPLQKT